MAAKNIKRVAQILKYGSKEIMLETSCKPEVKISTPSAIKVLKEIAFDNQIVSLSANQIGLEERVFVCLKDEHIQAGKWRDYQDLKSYDQYEAIINPIQTGSSYEKICGFEECPSFEGLRFKVWIPLFINLKFAREDDLSKQVEEQIIGFKCRVWDHEIRHLEGILPIHQKVCKGEFDLLDDYKNALESVDYYERIKAIEDNFKESNLKKLKQKVRRGKYESQYEKQNYDELKGYLSEEGDHSDQMPRSPHKNFEGPVRKNKKISPITK